MIEEIIEAVKNVETQDVLAIYLTGSRLNNTNVVPTDYDLFVITKPTLKSVMTGQHYVNHHIIEVNGIGVDIKAYDTLKLTQILLKSNPNTVEVFYKKPLFVSPNFADIADYLGSEEMLRYALAVNSTAFMKAIAGQTVQEGKSFVHGNVSLKRQGKIVAITIKFKHYLEEMIEYGILKSVEQPTELELELRRKTSGDVPEEQRTSVRNELFVEFEKASKAIDRIMLQVTAGELTLPTAELDYKRFEQMLMY